MLKSSLFACRVIIIKEMSHVLTWEELHRLSLVPPNSKRGTENVEIKQQNRLEPPLSAVSRNQHNHPLVCCFTQISHNIDRYRNSNDRHRFINYVNKYNFIHNHDNATTSGHCVLTTDTSTKTCTSASEFNCRKQSDPLCYLLAYFQQ